MARQNRCDQIDESNVGVYHCLNRCVRQAFLCGRDPVSGQNYEHRRGWIQKRLEFLAGEFAIDVIGFSVLSNHFHLILRNRPDLVAYLTDSEVAWRWWNLFPARRDADGSPAEPQSGDLKNLGHKIASLRRRLSSISWLMRCLTEKVARRANKEDETSGRFFAKRFDCKRLETCADVLACSIYVDLNWIHAGLARTPEQSRFTSAFDRIRGRWQDVRDEMGGSVTLPAEDQADAWLAPIYLDERAAAYGGAANGDPETRHAVSDGAERSPVCNPIGAARISNKGFLPMTRDQYLSLLDTLGRVIREGKRGFIAADLPPILERLKIDPQGWLDSILDLFRGSPRPRPSPAVVGSG